MLGGGRSGQSGPPCPRSALPVPEAGALRHNRQLLVQNPAGQLVPEKEPQPVRGLLGAVEGVVGARPAALESMGLLEQFVVTRQALPGPGGGGGASARRSPAFPRWAAARLPRRPGASPAAPPRSAHATPGVTTR